MKKKYEQDRIMEWNIDTMHGEIPIYCVKPITKSKGTKKLVLFIQGLNGNGSTIYYWNYPAFDNAYLVSFDARAQANNTLKPSRYYKTFIKDIDIIIDNLKQKLDFDEIYLMGESWGAALSVLYKKRYPEKINNLIIWNMPYRAVDVSKGKNNDSKIKRNVYMLSTFLFSINTYDQAPFAKELTNNKLLLRTVQLLRNNRLSNKVIIASWRSFKPAWKFLLKHRDELEKINITYIQSMEDVMLEMKAVNKLTADDKNVYIFEQGYHILTFDDNVNERLFDIISKIVNKKKVSK